jgi:hypothetical protein
MYRIFESLQCENVPQNFRGMLRSLVGGVKETNRIKWLNTITGKLSG